MEYLDIYDENGNFIGKEERNIVHRDALWHKTVHCWLYDTSGFVFFQIRKDEKKLYTTASGHVLAGETITEAFGREVKEEIGVFVDYEKASLVDVVEFKMDKIKKDGTVFRDRAFANVYICVYDGSDSDFDYDLDEVSGIIKVNAKDTLDLLKKENGTISGILLKKENHKIVVSEKEVEFNDFLVNEGETAIEKYGDVLHKIIEDLKLN